MKEYKNVEFERTGIGTARDTKESSNKVFSFLKAMETELSDSSAQQQRIV